MRCPNCGLEVGSDGAPFCPGCGMNLQGRPSRRKLRFILMDVQDDRRFRHLASAIVIAVVVIAVLSVLLVEWDGRTPAPEPEEPEPEPWAGYEVVYGEGFSEGVFSASLNANGELRIVLDPALAEGHTTFTWIFSSDDDAVYQFITKTADRDSEAAVLYWISPEIGRYTVTVSCDGTETHTGSFEYLADRFDQVLFAHDGVQYAVTVDVGTDEYLEYSGAYSAGRNTLTAAQGASFIVTGGAVGDLAQVLRDQYIMNNPRGSTTGEGYASYVLSFVRSYVQLSSDTVVHRASVYWAYPAETLYLGCGDEGDMAVLVASVLAASGYDAGIGVVDGLPVAAVHISGYATPDEIPDGFHVVRASYEGRYYYLCHMAADAPAGCMPEEYDYYDGRFYHHGSNVTSSSGVAVP